MGTAQLLRRSGFIVFAALTVGLVSHAASPSVVIPLKCSKGPEGQRYTAIVNAPNNVESGAEYLVRVDGASSGEVSHFGLNYIFNMTYEYLIPEGTSLVAGSLRVVPNTGTRNVQTNARITHSNSVVTMTLPGHVENGSRYTPPSFELKLKVNAASGSAITHKFAGYRVTANAVVVGDVKTVCVPKPKPFPVATIKVGAAKQ